MSVGDSKSLDDEVACACGVLVDDTKFQAVKIGLRDEVARDEVVGLDENTAAAA